jgi:hypothetical protein
MSLLQIQEINANQLEVVIRLSSWAVVWLLKTFPFAGRTFLNLLHDLSADNSIASYNPASAFTDRTQFRRCAKSIHFLTAGLPCDPNFLYNPFKDL